MSEVFKGPGGPAFFSQGGARPINIWSGYRGFPIFLNKFLKSFLIWGAGENFNLKGF